jgi:hypothetical protein
MPTNRLLTDTPPEAATAEARRMLDSSGGALSMPGEVLWALWQP